MHLNLGRQKRQRKKPKVYAGLLIIGITIFYKQKIEEFISATIESQGVTVSLSYSVHIYTNSVELKIAL
jgi:hypothetical protein